MFTTYQIGNQSVLKTLLAYLNLRICVTRVPAGVRL